MMTRSKSAALPLAIVLAQLVCDQVESFSAVAPPARPLFIPSQAVVTPSKTSGVDIELPDFDNLFDRISKISPLANMAFDGKEGGFAKMQDDSGLKWKTMEHDKKKKKPVFHIDKIDNFMKLGCPVVRFRSSIEGPCIGERFANFIMNLDERKLWDKQIEDVYNIYPIYDTDAANMVMGFEYGECHTLGVGYCCTKPNFVASGREQLTMCGIQEWDDGRCVIWGTEMPERFNHLLPDVDRRERANTIIFSTTLLPTGPNSFDVEYVLQLDCGGNIPPFMTVPVLTDTVKSLFKHAKAYFAGGEGSELAKYLEEQQQMDQNSKLFSMRKGLLLAP